MYNNTMNNAKCSLVTILILHGHVTTLIWLHYVATTILSLNFIFQLTCFGIKPSSDRCTFTGFKSDICVDQMNTLLLSMTLIWLYVSSCQNYIYMFSIQVVSRKFLSHWETTEQGFEWTLHVFRFHRAY